MRPSTLCMPGSECPSNAVARRLPESPGFSHGEVQAAPVTLWGFILSGTPLVQEAAAQGYMTEARAMSLQPRRWAALWPLLPPGRALARQAALLTAHAMCSAAGSRSSRHRRRRCPQALGASPPRWAAEAAGAVARLRGRHGPPAGAADAGRTTPSGQHLCGS